MLGSSHQAPPEKDGWWFEAEGCPSYPLLPLQGRETTRWVVEGHSFERGNVFVAQKQGQVNSRRSKKTPRPPPHRHHPAHRPPHPRRAGREAQRVDRGAA